MAKYFDKIMQEVTEGKRGSSYPAMKRLSLRPGDERQLPEHAELNLSSAQSAEIIANHFSVISQEYLPPWYNQFAAKCEDIFEK